MNKIQEIIDHRFGSSTPFRPTRAFYLSVGVNQKRFHQILRNEKQPTFDEAERLAKHFGVTIQDLIKN